MIPGAEVCVCGERERKREGGRDWFEGGSLSFFFFEAGEEAKSRGVQVSSRSW